MVLWAGGEDVEVVVVVAHFFFFNHTFFYINLISLVVCLPMFVISRLELVGCFLSLSL